MGCKLDTSVSDTASDSGFNRNIMGCKCDCDCGIVEDMVI